MPAAIAAAEEAITQSGGSALAPREPLAISASVITPIVFWASLVPCASASSPPETTWPYLKPRVTVPGRCRPTTR